MSKLMFDSSPPIFCKLDRAHIKNMLKTSRNFYLLETSSLVGMRKLKENVYRLNNLYLIFGMASMPFLCNGTLLFQGNLLRVLPVTIFKYASCLIP